MENISGLKWNELIIWTCGLSTCRHLAKNHLGDPWSSPVIRVIMSESVATSSRVWSCATLHDGLGFVADEAAKLEEEELELERQIKAPKNHAYIHNMPLNHEINHQIERHSALSEFPFIPKVWGSSSYIYPDRAGFNLM